MAALFRVARPPVVHWLTVAIALAGMPLPSAAAPAEDELLAEPADVSGPEAIFRRGQTKYETADYVGAIELWTEAYGLVESTPRDAAIKALLIFNLAQAHIKAFELDDDTMHLKQARALLESYAASLSLLYEDEAARAEEQTKVDEKLAEIAAALAAAEPVEPEPEPEHEPQHEPEPEPKPADTRAKPGNPLLFAGAGVTALGVAVGGVTITLGAIMGTNANDIADLEPDELDVREEQFARGARANTMLIAGAVVAGVLVPVGVALIGVGAKRNARARGEQARLPSFGPGFGRGEAGIVIRGAF